MSNSGNIEKKLSHLLSFFYYTSMILLSLSFLLLVFKSPYWKMGAILSALSLVSAPISRLLLLAWLYLRNKEIGMLYITLGSLLLLSLSAYLGKA